MKYSKIVKGRFIQRKNRFVATVILDETGERVDVHVKNTGRCKELLVEGATVFLQDFRENMGSRKMAFSLIGVVKRTPDRDLLINMDSQAPNKVVGEALENGSLFLEGMRGDYRLIKAEKTYGNSRFDFYVETDEDRAFVEVKGVTLEEDGIVRFPDAPTERGLKHIKELAEAMSAGYKAYVVFVIQMKGARYFSPNYNTHPQFGEELKEAEKRGVKIIARDCKVEEDSLILEDSVKVIL